MARIKPKNSIKTQDQAVAAMGKLNQIDTQLAQWDLCEAEQIAKVREEHVDLQRKAGRTGMEAEKALLIKELEMWSQDTSAAWERKTWETAFGRMGFRVSTPAVIVIKRVVKNFKEALELAMLYLPDFVRQSYEIDKEKILSAERSGILDVNELARCGLTIDQRDEFWLETAASEDLKKAAQKLKGA